MDTMPFRLVGKFKKNEVYYSGDIAIMDDNRSYVMLEGEWVLLREEAELEIDYSALTLAEEDDGQS